MNYGMPYMGSKSKIAEWVVSKLPPADVWIEPFAGGCAVTHAAMLSGKYKKFIINDITDSAKVFMEAISGKFRDENRWISREDFFKLKDNDAYVRLCFSFGNDQKTYCYGDIEPYKRALHYAVFFNDFEPFSELGVDIPKNKFSENMDRNARKIRLKRILIKLRGDVHAGDLQSLERLESLERLQSLESLESLERLQRLQSLESLQGDYKNVPIPIDTSYIIYCDPPYIGTTSYINEFNHEEFYDWAMGQDNCYISEYNMPGQFVKIEQKSKRSLLSANGKGKLMKEGIWVYKGKLKDVRNKSMSLFNI